MRTLYHGSRVTVEQPEIRIQKFHKDFYWGFYCTEYEAQAVRWATRFGSGIVNVYRFDEQPGLSIKRFPEMSDEWLDFIVACRSGVPHNYDIVEGPMADDTIFNYVQSYTDGEISRRRLLGAGAVQASHPSDQLPYRQSVGGADLREELRGTCVNETTADCSSPALWWSSWAVT